MRHRYCCEATRNLYEDYYASQSGSGLSVFQGSRSQAGHGLGSIFSRLFKFALPMLKSVGKQLGFQALRTGARIANDVADGESLRESSKKRLSETIKQYVPTYGDQSGSGKRRRNIDSRKKTKRLKHDIFD